jgi:hypothetical protein
LAVGHREDEEPFALLAVAHFCRLEQSSLKVETHSA